MARTDPPLYMQVAEALRERIRTGDLAPGDLLPTERDLAAQRKISRATAVRALEMLVSEGLVTTGNTRAGRRVRDLRILPVHASQTERVERRRAAGVDAWVADTRDAGRAPGQTIDVGVVTADAEIAAALQVAEGEPVAVRRRLRTLDGEPSNTAHTYYPMAIADGFPAILNPTDVRPGVIAMMAEGGYVLTHFVDRLRWRPPTPEEAQTLRIGQGTAVLIQTRVGYIEERPVHLTRTTWPGDTIELVYELPA
ncbi:GntR family transcriptional regulator [Marinactinospora thermotolerans]|uniref:GntR family transcriptional regulator n=1 Tax=Marinactinospora thermotolerans TaxID=531310 RepID=UPI003D92388B